MTKAEHRARMELTKGAEFTKELKQVIKDLIETRGYNNGIKWSVKRTATGYKITNDYPFESFVKVSFMDWKGEFENDEFITATDPNHWDEENQTFCYLNYGDKRWDDYLTIKEGLKMAVKACVEHFYYYY